MQTTLPKPKLDQYINIDHNQRPRLISPGAFWVLLFLGGVIWSAFRAGLFEGEIINSGGWSLLENFFRAITHPELSPEFLGLTLNAALTTLAYAVAGLFLSIIFGFVGGILSSEIWWDSLLVSRSRNIMRLPRMGLRAVLSIVRAIHEVIWGLFFLNILGLNPLTAILAIALPYGAIIAKVYSEILDETSHKSLTALLNSGVSAPKAFAYSLLPEAFLDMLSYSFYRFECAIRSATVLGIIGAGGLGYEIFLSLQTLKYGQIWTLLLALFALNGLADSWSSALRQKIGIDRNCGGSCAGRVKRQAVREQERFEITSDPLIRYSMVAAVLFVPLSFITIQPDLGRLFSEQTIQQFQHIGSASLPPDFSNLTLSGWLSQAAITLAMSFLAVAAAGMLAYLLAFPAARTPSLTAVGEHRLRRWMRRMIRFTTRGLLLVARSIPAPIWALLLLFVLFPGILPGAAALGIYTLGVFGRLMAEIVENLDTRPLTALQAQGAGPVQVFAYGTLPLTFPRFIAYLFTRWEETIRTTVVIGLVGAGGLGRLLIEQLSSFDYQSLTATLIVFVGIIMLVDLISNAARKQFR